MVDCCTNMVECCTNVVDCSTILIQNNKNINCKFCNRLFNDRSNKFKHEKICKQKEKVINKSIDDNIDKKLEEF